MTELSNVVGTGYHLRGRDLPSCNDAVDDCDYEESVEEGAVDLSLSKGKQSDRRTRSADNSPDQSPPSPGLSEMSNQSSKESSEPEPQRRCRSGRPKKVSPPVGSLRQTRSGATKEGEDKAAVPTSSPRQTRSFSAIKPAQKTEGDSEEGEEKVASAIGVPQIRSFAAETSNKSEEGKEKTTVPVGSPRQTRSAAAKSGNKATESASEGEVKVGPPVSPPQTSSSAEDLKATAKSGEVKVEGKKRGRKPKPKPQVLEVTEAVEVEASEVKPVEPVEKRAKKRPLSLSLEQGVASSSGSSESGAQDVFRQLRESIISQGIWIQCAACTKWRHLPPGSDPSQQPAPWYCSMNRDETYSNCSAEQQVNLSADEDLIAAEFSLGSIVWAKTPGFPWWPAMVDIDPDSYEFYWIEESSKKLTHYNVTYFDEKVSRAWVTTSNIRRFTGDESGTEWLLTGKHQNYAKQREVAVQQAKAAILLAVEERAERYGFVSHVCKERNASGANVLNKIIASPASSRDSGVCSSVSPISRTSSAATTISVNSSNLASELPTKTRRTAQQVPSRKSRSRRTNIEEDDEDEVILAPPKPMSLTDWLMNGPRQPVPFFDTSSDAKS